MYIQGKYYNGTEQIDTIYALRKNVFGYTEISEREKHYYELDSMILSDQMAIHGVLYIGGKEIACGSLYYDGQTFLIDFIGVKMEERRKKYGDFIVRMLVDKVFSFGGKEIILFAEKEMVPFFQTIGFQITSEKIVRNNFWITKMRLIHGGLCKECKQEV